MAFKPSKTTGIMQRDSASIGMNPRLGLLLLQIRCFMDHWQEQLRDELASEKVVTAALLETLQCELARAPPQACYLKTLGLTWCRLSHVFSLPPLPAISPCGPLVFCMLFCFSGPPCNAECGSLWKDVYVDVAGAATTAACANPGKILALQLV